MDAGQPIITYLPTKFPETSSTEFWELRIGASYQGLRAQGLEYTGLGLEACGIGYKRAGIRVGFRILVLGLGWGIRALFRDVLGEFSTLWLLGSGLRGGEFGGVGRGSGVRGFRA